MKASPVDARFVARVNRFRVRVELGGTIVDAHLPNPGRLGELLAPGIRVRMVPANSSNRTTAYDLLAARCGREWVCLDTRLANVAVRDALDARTLPEFSMYGITRQEVRWRDSRFDFLLEKPGRCWVEVKSCSLVRDGRALFPDAPTARGTKHLRGLASLARHGAHAAVLFVVVRRAVCFSPNDAADPAFGQALRDAADAGVEIHARRASLHGRHLVLDQPLPTDL